MKSLSSISYKVLTALMIVVLALGAMPVSPAYAATDTYSTPGTFTWIAPAGVTSVTVQAWGGGGGGGRANNNNGNKGGGGAGGQFATSVITVIPGNSYTVVVGAGGAGGTNGSGTNGLVGGDSIFNTNSVVAKGGAGGTGNGAGGAGATTGGIGTTVFRGGNGSAGNGTSSGAAGGAGGGGAGTTGNGGDATGNAAGTGTTIGGGAGGAGRTTGGVGNSGVTYGGGGGGAYRTGGNSQDGGAGAGGQVILTYVTPPTVTVVSSTAANGTYSVGAVIPVTITFSSVVNVTGTPQLTLETGAVDRVVDYSSGTGTNILTFNYTVQPGDTSVDLNYVATTSLVLNGGTIRDAALTNAVLTLPAVGGANSLGGQKNIVIDTTAPTATIDLRAASDTGTSNSDNLTNAASPIFDVAFNEGVSGLTNTDFSNAGGTATGCTFAVGAPAGNTYPVTVSGCSEGTLILRLATSGVSDGAGNLNAQTDGPTVTIDRTGPSVTINQQTTPPQADPTSASPINFAVVFTEAVTNFATGDVNFTGSTVGGTLTGTVTGSGTTYNVAVTGMTTAGNVVASIIGGVATDAAGNNNSVATFTDHTVSYTTPIITVDTGAGGAITPPGTAGPNTGSVSVISGSDSTFDITPAAGYVVLNIQENQTSGNACNSPVGRVNSHTFLNVTGNRRICATFDGGWSAPQSSANSGGTNWNTITNGYDSDNQRATSNGLGLAGSVDYFNFNIPAIPTGATIDGIEVSIEGFTSGPNLNVSISGNTGGSFTATQATTLGASEATAILGGAANLWGTTWIPADFTNAEFRLRVASPGGLLTQFSLDQVQVKVYYRQPTNLVVSPATGTYGGTVDLTATLTVTNGGAPLSGQTISFFLNGNPTSPVGSAVTNASGVATLNLANAASLAGINAGTYGSGVSASYAGASGSPGYAASSDTDQLRVNPATLAVNAVANSKTYGDADPAFTYTLSGFQNGENAISANVTGTPSCTRTAGEAVAGSPYTITCAPGSLAALNYTFVTGATAAFTIDRATLAVNAASGSKAYGDADPALTYTLSGFQNGENAASASVTGTASCTRTAGETVAGNPYIITCTPGTLAAPNYNFVSGTTANFTINGAVLSVNAVANSKTYGDADPSFTYTLSGFQNGEDALSASVTGSASCTRIAGETVVGSPYTITCVPDTLAAPNYTFATGAAADFTINRATLSVNAVVDSKTYGDADPAFTYTLSGFQNGENAISANVIGTPSCTRTAGESVAGSPYTITCAPGSLAAPNYDFVTGATAAFTIDRAILSVNAVANSKTYGDADPALSYTLSGFQNGENATTAGVLGTASCARTVGESVVGSPYTITCASGTLAAANYNFVTGATADFNINGAVLSVNAVANSKTYGDADPAFTYTLSGFQNGENATSAGVTGTPSCTRISGESVVGSPYTITCTPGTLAASDYTFATGTTANFIIDRATLSVNAVAGLKAYGDPDPALTYVLSGFQSGEDAISAGVTGAGSCTRTAGEAVPGPYTITCMPGSLAAPNYDFITGTTANFTIGGATLSVNAVADSKTYGDADPAFTYTLSGFQNGENATTAGVTGLGSCTRTAGESVAGSPYAITCTPGSLTAPNYAIITGTTANFTIDQRPITVTAVTDSRPYNGTTSSVGTPTITSGTMVPGDGIVLTQTFDNKNVGNGKDLIPNAVITDGSGGNNYDVTYINDPNGEITAITVRVNLITVSNKVYDGTTAATINTAGAGLNTADVISGDNVTLVVAGATGAFVDLPVGTGRNVGNNKDVAISGLSLSGTDAVNYILIPPVRQANITQRAIGVTAQPNTKLYDSTTTSATVPTISSGTLAVGDTPAFTQSYTTPNVGAGKTLTPTGDVNDGNGGGNYVITFFNNTLGVIQSRPLVVTADPKTKAFGAPDPAFTYTYTGTLQGSDFWSGTLSRVPGEGVSTYAILQGTLTAGPNYTITYNSALLTIVIINQTITVVTPAPANAAYLTNFNVAATASSGLPVTISTTGGACSGSGTNGIATITMLSGTGFCTIHYNQIGNLNFGPALEVTETTNAQKANQTIIVNAPAIGATAVYNTGFNATATATSGLPVTYTSGGTCTNVGSNFNMTSGTGTCTVFYDQPGDANNYNAAPQVTRTVTAQKANQTINVTTSAPGNAGFNGNFTVAATASSGLAVTYSSTGSCNNAGALFTMTSSTGTCSVQFNQTGDNNYNAAPQVTQTVNALKADQTITVTISAPVNAAYNSNFTVAATASSGLAVTYNAIGSCTNVGATFTMTASTGTCTVQYDQPGNVNFNPAPQLAQTVNAQKANQTISVTISAPSVAQYDSDFTVAATASSGLAVVYSASGACTNSGSPTFTMTASTGTCIVQYNQAGNANYNPAIQVTENVNAQKADQTITVTTPAPITSPNGSSFVVAATASSGLTVAYSASGVCTNVGATFTMNASTGICTVHYNQAGDANYNPANEVTADTSADLIDQTITVVTHAPANAAFNTSFTVAATASSGLAVNYSASGSCTNAGPVFTVTVNSGTCTVHYNQLGDANYNPALEITEDSTIFVDVDGPTVTIDQEGTVDPTNISPIKFTVVFSEAVTGFDISDLIITGTAGATTAVITGTGPTYTVALSGMTGDGTVIVSILAGVVTDASGNPNSPSTSTDNIVTYLDGNGPTVQLINTNPETPDHVLSNSESVTFNITEFKVQFNQDVYNPSGDSNADDVTNPNNYMLIRDLGDTGGLQTVSCVAGAVVPADTKITIGAVSYDSQTYTATFTVNGGLPLSNGDYHLFVCGTTSIVDPLNNALALVGSSGQGGTDYRHSFTVSISGNGGGGGSDDDNGGGASTTKIPLATSGFLIPVTGFSPNEVTMLPVQPEDRAYSSMDNITIEIPSLGIKFPIVGVSVTDNGWNLTWLKDNVGYLESSAYPTFNGNTVLTAHVRDANKHLGPFSDIKGLQLGDKILLHAYGKVYVYEVQENTKISPKDIETAFRHEEYSWVTLVTCEDYNAKIEEYYHRRMVRAVLISVVPER